MLKYLRFKAAHHPKNYTDVLHIYLKKIRRSALSANLLVQDIYEMFYDIESNVQSALVNASSWNEILWIAENREKIFYKKQKIAKNRKAAKQRVNKRDSDINKTKIHSKKQ